MSICGHPDLSVPLGERDMTTASMIWDPQALTVEVCAGPPCENERRLFACASRRGAPWRSRGDGAARRAAAWARAPAAGRADAIQSVIPVAPAVGAPDRHHERERTVKIAVIGMGYVGLPLAVTFAEAGVEVVGIEADPTRCSAINSGDSYIGRRHRRGAQGRGRQGPAHGHHRLRRHRELRRRHHLPADPAQCQPRTRPDARQAGHRRARRPRARRPARVPREHRPTRARPARCSPRSSKRVRDSPPAPTSTSPSRRNGSTPGAPTTPPGRRPRSSAASRRPAPRRSSRSTARRSTASCRSPPPRWPR